MWNLVQELTARLLIGWQPVRLPAGAGYERLVEFAHTTHKDEYGELLRIQTGDEPIVLVKVVNSTPEPDGTFRDYLIRVDPHCRTAREAVAWTFDLHPDDYRPTTET